MPCGRIPVAGIEIAYVGDSWDNDIMSARAHKLLAAHLRCGL